MKIHSHRLKYKPVISDAGYEIGFLRDLIIDENGFVLFYLCESRVKDQSKMPDVVKRLHKDSSGLLMVPASTVKGIGEVIVVRDKLLKIYLMKRKRKSM